MPENQKSLFKAFHMKMHKIRLGDEGESTSVDFLKTKGYKILERNYRSKFGEIDIIAKEKDMLCFVEVKTRSSLTFGLPQEALIKKKRKHISRAALDYLNEAYRD